MGKKTILQYNFEFLDYLQNRDLPMPTKLISPSSWGLATVFEELNIYPDIVRPPLFTSDFHKVREDNLKRRGFRRFLHIQGRKAVHDRNGTDVLIEAASKSKSNFELVIKTQGDYTPPVDHRIRYDTSDPDNFVDLYKDFDAMFIPRKYGGLCLPMNEALCSGLPVIMTDVSPNSDLLPSSWLVKASSEENFMTRTRINIYEADIEDLRGRIDFFANMNNEDLIEHKVDALSIGVDNFDAVRLKKKYMEIINE